MTPNITSRSLTLGNLNVQSTGVPTIAAELDRPKTGKSSPAKNTSLLTVDKHTTFTRNTTETKSFGATSDFFHDINKDTDNYNLENTNLPKSPYKNSIKSGMSKVGDTHFDMLLARGLTVNRPEIVSVFDYYSIGKRNPTTEQAAADEFIKIQHSARSLLHDNISTLLEYLSEDTTAVAELDKIEGAIGETIRKSSASAKFLISGRIVLDEASSDLDPFQSVEKVDGFISSIIQSRNETNVKYDTLFSILQDRGYSKESLQRFSGTKILTILLGDVGILLNDERRLDTSVREADVSATDLTFTMKDGFMLSQLSAIKPVSSTTDLSVATSMLSSDLSERIEILVTALAKELRLSASLALRKTRQDINSYLGTMPAAKELVDMIIGIPPKNVLSVPRDVRTAIRKLYVTDDPRIVVLPFEKRALKTTSGQFIPGSDYYVESIVSGHSQFNARPIAAFSTAVQSEFEKVTSVIRQLVLADDPSGLQGTDVFDDIAQALSKAAGGVSDEKSIGQQSALSFAILRASQDNQQIKSLALKLINLLVIARLEAGNVKIPDGSITAPSPSPSKITVTATLQDIQADLKNFGSKFLATDAKIKSPMSRKIASNVAQDSGVLLEMVAKALEDEIVGNFVGNITHDKLFKNVMTIPDLQKGLAFNNPVKTAIIPSSSVSSMLIDNVTFSELVDLIEALVTRATAVADGTNFMVNDKTRFNSLDVSHIVYIVYEIFSAMAEKFLLVDFIKSTTQTDVMIDFYPKNNLTFVDMVDDKLTNRSSSTVVTAVPVDDIDKLRSQVSDTDDIVTALLDAALAISKNVDTASIALQEFFNTSSSAKNSSTLKALQENYTPPEISMLFSREQIALTLAGLDSIGNDTASIMQSPMFDSHIVDDSSLYLIKALCDKSDIFGEHDDTVKILTIGIPAGMTATIPGAFDSINGKNIRTPKENDVIKVKIYRKNYEFDDVVYKPREYVFDISKFVRPGKFNDSIEKNVSLDEVVTSLAQFIDTGTSVPITSMTGTEIIADSDYTFLSENDREKMIRNTVNSYILGMYIRLMAGFDLSEYSFLAGQDSASRGNLPIVRSSIKLLQALLGFSGRTISPLTLDQLRAVSAEIDDFVIRIVEFAEANGITLDTSSPTVEDATNLSDGLTSTVLSFSKIFGGASFISGFGGLSQRLTAPKVFERVFHIPINIDSFEIDTEQTSKTTTGAAFLKNRKFNKMKKETTHSDSTRIASSIRLDDLFVVIEPAYES